MLYCIGRDVTEQREMQRALAKKTRLVNAVNQVLSEAIRSDTEETLARVSLKICQELTGSAFGFICELNSRGRIDTIAISDTGWEACRIPGGRELLMAQDLVIRGIRGRVIIDQQALIFNAPKEHPDWIDPPQGHPTITSLGWT